MRLSLNSKRAPALGAAIILDASVQLLAAQALYQAARYAGNASLAPGERRRIVRPDPASKRDRVTLMR
jgi:hypothetical protein